MPRGLRNIAFGVLVCAFALGAQAQAVASWEATEHDFGSFLDVVKKQTCQMRVVNTGDSALLITRVQSNCGCTVAEYTRHAIAPHDTGSVSITYFTRDIPGDFEKSVFVYTNAKPRRSVLTVRGRVIGSPENVADHYPVAVGVCRLNSKQLPLGEVLKGESRNSYLSGYNASPDTMIVGASSASRSLAVHTMPDTVAPGGLFIVSCYYTSAGDVPYGFNAQAFAVTSRPIAGGKETSTECEATLQVKEDFSKLTEKQRRNAPVAVVSTDKVNFEAIAGSKPESRSFTISNQGKDPLIIRRMYLPDCSGVDVSANRLTVKGGKTATITVTVTPTELLDNVINTQLIIITNDPYTPCTRLRVVGVKK